MSCSSAIYGVNTSSTAIADGGTYPINTVVRRFGCRCQLSNNAITLSGSGYYDVAVSGTFTSTAVGKITMSVYQNGTLIPGMSATQTISTAGDIVSLNTSGMVRTNCSSSTITVVISGQAVNGTNLAVDVTRQ